jgi:ribosomal protein S15P/S13E
MIANIMFFIGYTILVFIIASERVRRLLDIMNKQEEMHDDCVSKLKLRSEQIDMLMETINNLNKQLQEAKQD